MTKLSLFVAAALLLACRDATAPAPQSCDPNKNPKDSLLITFSPTTGQSDTVPVLVIKWCGPIEVK